MAATEILKGKYICTEGQDLDAIHIIVTGSVKAEFPGGEITLKKGDIVGLCDIAYDSHFFSYSTLENSSFISFQVKEKNSIAQVVSKNPEVARMMYISMINQTLAVLSNYLSSKEACNTLSGGVYDSYLLYQDISSRNNIISRSLPQFDDRSEFNLENDIYDWIYPYYASIYELPQEMKLQLAAKPSFLIGFLQRASMDIHEVLSALSEMSDFQKDNVSIYLQENRLDLFDLYSSLLLRLPRNADDYDITKNEVNKILKFISENKTFNHSLYEERVSEYNEKLSAKEAISNHPDAVETNASKLNPELVNSLDTIIEYAAIDDDLACEFRSLINQYKKLKQKDSTEDSVRKLRASLSEKFFEVYSEAFIMSVKDLNIPRVLKMFFNFGYVDEELAGIENANYLLSIVDDFTGDKLKGVYTAHEWLMAVYRLEKEPSRNELDVDYFTHLHERKVAGKITAEVEKRLSEDPAQRTLYELSNMFPQCNKVTYGRISVYCPVFSEHDIIKPLNKCLVNVEALMEAERRIESIDYGAFYRETMYVNESAGIAKEYVYTKILPDIILFPNIGSRGIMWQEIEGKKRSTPSRFMISAFHLESLENTLIRLVAEYRWEMCKRIQGARWNDVSERSLTSEYCDYVQFYKKNSDLSQDAKEKVKTSLAKAKNSFKEMFVLDYITWILYEGTGSPRLNRVARNILCTYCPFPLELRTKISANPMFKEILDRYNIKTQQKLRHFDNVITKLSSGNIPVPDELRDARSFIEGSVK